MDLLDARDKLAAFANRLGGKGSESEEYYRNCVVSFNDVPNMHSIQASFKKLRAFLVDFTRKGQKSFYSVLGESGWMRSLNKLLGLTLKMVEALQRGRSVFVHCSDGWDRTSQVCALAQMLLDPYYRTLDGFLLLVEKEFSQAGHLFARRNRIFSPSKSEQSPIFLQFLDAVQNIVTQFPNCFEFGAHLLRDLGLVSYFGVFSNFIANNQREREQMRLDKYALHSFDFFNAKRRLYMNPGYCRDLPLGRLRIKEVNLRFWKEFFFMYFEQSQHDFEIPMI